MPSALNGANGHRDARYNPIGIRPWIDTLLMGRSLFYEKGRQTAIDQRSNHGQSRRNNDAEGRLINRTTRSLSLTEEGREFHAHCLTLIAQARHAEEAMATRRDSSGAKRGAQVEMRIAQYVGAGLAGLAILSGRLRRRRFRRGGSARGLLT